MTRTVTQQVNTDELGLAGASGPEGQTGDASRAVAEPDGGELVAKRTVWKQSR